LTPQIRNDESNGKKLRLIMVKADGSVLLHADAGGYKPLNWN
jgi:RecB family endonuclease NucS